MSNESDKSEGTYNPSGGIPSHPADPQFGDKDADDAYDADDDTPDEDTPAEPTPAEPTPADTPDE